MASIFAPMRRISFRQVLGVQHWQVACKLPPGRVRRRQQISTVTGKKKLEVGIDRGYKNFDYVFLRDACTCQQCIDPSTRQRLFQTSDIPANIKTRDIKPTAEGNLKLTWENDIPGYGDAHISEITPQFVRANEDLRRRIRGRYNDQRQILWDRGIMEENVKWIEYKEYVADDEKFFEALLQLSRYGLVFLKGVPDSERAIETIGNRIGPLRDTFYGRTWDVKSVPNAKNIAYVQWFPLERLLLTYARYTPHNLGLHMDLLYFANPPTLQLLHCLRNSVTGGSSIFSDSFHAATRIQLSSQSHFKSLTTFPVTFHYRNAGEHYHYIRPTVELEQYSYRKRPRIANVNWSPPFQGPYEIHLEGTELRLYLAAVKEFAKFTRAPQSQFELTLKPGECVIFNNRRVLHARRAFDPSSGERWLKGAYVDGDPFQSRLRVLSETLSHAGSEVDFGGCLQID
ncbi:hypothetical protein FGG08_000806 [Glutinoglossum americanum]|uniref:Gamma-butyrobetaine dioxygenase n=1 Tax=Glutinoglossum americanum TaxID=1670608 RepID=A0A9P8IC61_9PEZI|nr:hypothetical protein FGG08_000806 [Glutinoglossum americanum]